MTQEDDWAEKEARRLYGLFGCKSAEEWHDAGRSPDLCLAASPAQKAFRAAAVVMRLMKK